MSEKFFAFYLPWGKKNYALGIIVDQEGSVFSICDAPMKKIEIKIEARAILRQIKVEIIHDFQNCEWFMKILRENKSPVNIALYQLLEIPLAQEEQRLK